MPKEKNTAIGEMECPFRGCTCRASVHRYRERSADDKKRRFAGRVYAICERKHRCEDQDFILENATIWGATKNTESAPAPDLSAPVKAPEKPALAPVQKAPVRTSPAPATPEQSPVLSTGEVIKRSGGWGWFR